MASTPFPNTPPDGRRAGATWVAATGAFLLLASAMVFVAVRWDQLPEGAKVALVGALTGGFLAGGRALRRSLPATGEVLFHLGALLIPVDVAALSLRLDLGWRPLLLAEGLVGVGVLGALAATAGSVVLTAAAGASVVVLAAGIAGISPIPAPLALVAAAAAAHLLGHRRPAIAWAGLAGLAPVLGAVAAAGLRLVDAELGTGAGAGVLVELGLGGRRAALVALASSTAAAVILGREAARRHDLALVALAGASLASGAAITWINADPSRHATFLAVPALFLLVQVVAMLFRRDAFWARPAKAVALAAEVAAGVLATPVAAAILVAAPFVEDGLDLFGDRPGWTPQPAAAAGWALLSGGWLLAAWRRLGPSGPAQRETLGPRGPAERNELGPSGPSERETLGPSGPSERETLGPSGPSERETPGPSGPSERETPGPSGPAERAMRRAPTSPLAALRAAVADDRTVLFLASTAGAAAVIGSASSIAIGVALVVLAAGLAASRGVLATVVAAAAAVWAPLVVGSSHPLAALPVGLVAAAVLGVAAVAWRSTARGWVATGLATAGSAVAFASCGIATESIGLMSAMPLAVTAAWALAALVERACPLAGHVVRATMLVGMAGALSGTSADAVAVAALGTLLFALDAIRHDEPIVALGAALGLQVIVGVSAWAAGLDLATTGLVLCGSALAYVALSALYPARWRLPFVAAAVAGLLAGLPLASGDGARFAEALILAGGLAIAAGLILRSGVVGHSGGVLAVAGVGLHLVVDGVTALEAFAAPVAVQLLVAGWQLRGGAERGRTEQGEGDDRPSSWIAYGPAIALLGGAALAERLSGGEAWHGLVAGAVGVTAVAAGGWRRLAGPLFLGTGLVVGVTILESLGTLAGVPTWAWLAAGGLTLLTTGVALERTATSPVEAGRRLVDVVDERFT